MPGVRRRAQTRAPGHELLELTQAGQPRGQLARHSGVVVKEQDAQGSHASQLRRDRAGQFVVVSATGATLRSGDPAPPGWGRSTCCCGATGAADWSGDPAPPGWGRSTRSCGATGTTAWSGDPAPVELGPVSFMTSNSNRSRLARAPNSGGMDPVSPVPPEVQVRQIRQATQCGGNSSHEIVGVERELCQVGQDRRFPVEWVPSGD